MSSANFTITTHHVPGQHIREYPRATLDAQEDVLYLEVKQYVPVDNKRPKRGDVTIVGAHANGFPKEMYEPLWDEILLRAKEAGIGIRGIWIADVAHQGASGVLNEGKLGNDPSWYDTPRDLLHIINHFRADMPRPLVGVGHSFGGNVLTSTALIHPRLFETLILVDPVILKHPPSPEHGRASAFRRDLWPSREAAAASFRQSKFYQAWDPRVLDRYIQFGLRDLPTLIYPDARVLETSPKPPHIDKSTISLSAAAGSNVQTSTPVTLTTTKHQELFTFLRPNYQLHPPLGELLTHPLNHQTATQSPKPPSPPHLTPAQKAAIRLTHPDIPPEPHPPLPFYSPATIITYHRLPELRPSVLYLLGATSPLSPAAETAERAALTGIGIGGSGGEAEGRVQQVRVEGAGHLVPMERPGRTAEEAVRWMEREVGRWWAGEEREWREWRGAGVGRRERVVMDERWLENVRDLGRTKHGGTGGRGAKL